MVQAELVAGLLLVAASLLLLLWRRGYSVTIMLVLLWSLLLLAWAGPLVNAALYDQYFAMPDSSLAGRRHADLDYWLQAYGATAGSYGISLSAALGWSAYLLSAPAIRARHPSRRDRKRDKEALDVF